MSAFEKSSGTFPTRNMVISNNGLRSTIVLPALSYTDFDRTGSIAIWKIASLFELARVLPFRDPKYILQKLVGEGYLTFIVIGDMNINKDAYLTLKQKWMDIKLELTCDIVQFLRRALILECTIREVDSKTSLGTMALKYVTIDANTRKAKDLPAWAHTPGPQSLPPKDAMLYKIRDIPSNAFVHNYTVMPSDTDWNRHTNNTTYIRLAIDAATIASHKGALKGFSGDICTYKTKNIKMYYKRETNWSHELSIYVWTDNDTSDELVLHFTFKKLGAPVFFCDMEFYPKPLQSKY